MLEELWFLGACFHLCMRTLYDLFIQAFLNTPRNMALCHMSPLPWSISKRAYHAIAGNFKCKSWSPAWSQGWHLTAIMALAATTIMNVTLLIWYYVSTPTLDGVKVLFHGSCKKAARLDTWLHLLINIVSTILLAGSNFSESITLMQRSTPAGLTT